MATILLRTIAGLWAVLWGGFAAISWKEDEPRATRRAGALALGGALLLVSASFLPLAVQTSLALGLLVTAAGLTLLFLLPIGRLETGQDTPTRRVDERTIMFARARLQPGSPEYEAYYRLHPEHKKGDERTRRLPGLLSPQARFADPLQFASPQGSFFLTEALREAVDGPVAPQRLTRSAADMTAYIKGLTRYFGARDVGIARLRPEHIYTHIGRGSGQYGAEIHLEHEYAIAFTVEMEHRMVGAAPRGPIIMESGRQYVEAARVAVQLAAAIRALGYPARAHIDGNYRVIAPLVARDAGLGEIGRMGLLMTPRLGPRVRLGVVTTTLPLTPDGRKPSPAMLDFCTLCEKCALNCPSKSIPRGPRQMINGALRWQINPDTCFRYWNVIGTDCGRCMAVCPFSHPDNPAHNLVRWGVRHSGAFRRLALWLDDVLYGKKPLEKSPPRWLPAGNDNVR